MKRFVDRGGAPWDVVLGRASWGALLALFVPVGRTAPVRQAMLRSADYYQAQRLLDEATPETLQELLDRSEPKDE
jgi:hypothetical protein